MSQPPVSQDAFWEIISAIVGIFGIIAAILLYFMPRISRRVFKRSIQITRLYPAEIFPEMALGIQGSGFNPCVEKNSISFHQEGKVLSVSGEEVTGGATAPREAVLTVRVPSSLTEGSGKLTVFNGFAESNALDFRVTGSPASAVLRQLQTPFAADRNTGLRSGKLLVIGGEGFSFEEMDNEVIFEWEDGELGIRQLSAGPAEVRGDALLGVRVPQGVPIGSVSIKVRTTVGGRQAGESNKLHYHVFPQPRLLRLSKPYVRPGEELTIYGEHFDPNNIQANLVRLTPYQSRVPIESIPIRVTETELRIRIPKHSGSFPGPYDVVVEVHQVPSNNSLVLDIQNERRLFDKILWPKG